MKKSMFLAAVAFIAITAFGQQDPNAVQPQPGVQPPAGQGQGQQRGGGGGGFNIAATLDNQMNQAETFMELTDSGIFLYKAGTLAKLDYLTLTVQKKVELFGPMPEKPAAPAQPAANGGAMALDPETLAYVTNVSKRLALPTIIATDDNLFFVVGDSFFKVNQLTMAIELNQPLSKTADPNLPAPAQQTTLRALLGNNIGGNLQAKPPLAKIKENIMVLLKPDEILLIDTLTGKVSTRNPLPQEFVTKPAAFGGGMGRGGMGGGGGAAGGGGGRGARGGGGAAGGGGGRGGGGRGGRGGGAGGGGGAAPAPGAPAVQG